MLIAEVSVFMQSLEHILGFLIVLLALSLLWLLTASLGLFFRRAKPNSPVNADWVTEEAPTEEEVAAIAAVVMSLMGPRSHIVSIRSSTKDWNREGRREHFASHRFR
jgi:Na+-transporting methylmalonyl-CoA/oxaloacetate decarboxylase gamma subunit